MTDKPANALIAAGGGLLAPEPDWLAIRDDYEQSGDTIVALAEKHGVSKRQLLDRRARQGWWRPGRRTGATRDAVATMAKSIECAVRKMIKRDARLMNRVIERGGALDEELAQHRAGIEPLGAMLKMVHTLRKLRAAAPPQIEDEEEKRRTARRNIEVRVTRMAAMFQAESASGDDD